MATVEHRVTVQLTHQMTWIDFKREAEQAGVPGDAKMSSYHYDAGRDPRETSYTNLIFTW